jgi:hypothetical protein
MASLVSGAVPCVMLLCMTPTFSMAQPPPPRDRRAIARMMSRVPAETLAEHRIPPSALRDFNPVVALTITGSSPTTIWVNHDYRVAYILSNFTLEPVSGQVSAVAGAQVLKAEPASGGSLTLEPGESLSGWFQGEAGAVGGRQKVSLVFGKPLPCKPDGHGGSICPRLPVATDTVSVLVSGVGEILSSSDPLPAIGDVGGTICNGALFARSTDVPNEWEETPGGHDVPVAGRVINTEDAGVDIPFDHPFGFDYWFHIEPDRDHFGFLNSPGIASRSDCTPGGLAAGAGDGDTCKAFEIVRGQGGTPTGALHTEVERGLIPDEYRPRAGERVYARGRRIVDCGHSDYNVELHPPTIMARAWQEPTLGQVRSTLIATPYVTRQIYLPGHNDFVRQVAGELSALAFSPSPSPIHLLADIEPASFDGNLVARYEVALPPRRGFDDARIRYHFVTRPGVTVAVQALTTYQAAVLVSVDPARYVPHGPASCGVESLSLSDAEKLGGLDPGTLQSLYDKAVGLIASGVLTLFGVPPNVQINVAAAARAGLFYYQCSVPDGGLPTPGSILDNRVVVDSSQPYPVYGWLDIDFVSP